MKSVLNILSKINSRKRESIFWDSSSFAFTRNKPSVEIISLQLYPRLSNFPALVSDYYKLEICIFIQLQGVEEEILTRIYTKSRFDPINLIPILSSSKLCVGPEMSLGIRANNVGRESLKFFGKDQIIIYGAAMVETPGYSRELEASNRSEIVFSVSARIAVENTKRLSLTIINAGEKSCWINLGRTAVVNTGIFLLPGGSSYLINTNNPWFASVEAICQSGDSTRLSICEVSYS